MVLPHFTMIHGKFHGICVPTFEKTQNLGGHHVPKIFNRPDLPVLGRTAALGHLKITGCSVVSRLVLA